MERKLFFVSFSKTTTTTTGVSHSCESGTHTQFTLRPTKRRKEQCVHTHNTHSPLQSFANEGGDCYFFLKVARKIPIAILQGEVQSYFFNRLKKMEEKKFSRLFQGLSVRTIFQAMSPVVLSPMKMKERTCRIQRSPLVFILLLLKEKRERTGGTIFKCVHIQRRMDRT